MSGRDYNEERNEREHEGDFLSHIHSAAGFAHETLAYIFFLPCFHVHTHKKKSGKQLETFCVTDTLFHRNKSDTITIR